MLLPVHFCTIKDNKMKPGSRKHEHTRTAYILLDTGKCKACWKCLEKCSNNVIGRINLPWHKHARISNDSICTGCLKCVNACAFNALSVISIIERKEINK